jgi:hypothetical protein
MNTENALADIHAAAAMSDYDAVGALWDTLLKLANEMAGKEEFDRMKALLRHLTDTDRAAVLGTPAVLALIDLDPPLETVLANPHERLEADECAREIEFLRNHREDKPDEALFKLGSMIKRIRNKRMHGFKARGRPRDAEILGAARTILSLLCSTLVERCEEIDPTNIST